MAKYGVRKHGKRWVARPYVPGRGHIYVKGSFDSEAEATKAALELIEQERLLPAHRETIATFAARWVKDWPRPKESTNDAYRAAAKRFAHAVGPAKKLHEYTVPEANAYARQFPYDAPKLNVMFNDARREGLIRRGETSPFSALGISKGRGRKDIVVVTADELSRLADIALQAHGPDEYGPIFRALLIFAAHSGLRSSENSGLDWPHLDFEAEEIDVCQQFYKRRLTLPKNNQTRRVFFSPPAIEAVRSMPRRVGVEPVFVGKLGQRISQAALSGYWAPVRTAFEAALTPERRAEFQRVPNSLDFYSVTRHYCATFLIEEGVPSWIVARQLGHEDGGRLVEKVYGHPSDRVARERLRQAFQQNVRPIRPVDDAEEATG